MAQKKENMQAKTQMLSSMNSLNGGSLFSSGCRRGRRTSSTTEVDTHRSLSSGGYVVGYLGPDLENLNWEGGGEYLFALTVITTIGYGVFVPSTDDGKIFTMIYAIVGFCVLGYTMGKTMSLIEKILRFLIRGVVIPLIGWLKRKKQNIIDGKSEPVGGKSEPVDGKSEPVDGKSAPVDFDRVHHMLVRAPSLHDLTASVLDGAGQARGQAMRLMESATKDIDEDKDQDHDGEHAFHINSHGVAGLVDQESSDEDEAEAALAKETDEAVMHRREAKEARAAADSATGKEKEQLMEIAEQKEARALKEEAEVEEAKVHLDSKIIEHTEDFILLVVYSISTYGFLHNMAVYLNETEHWEDYNDAFYFAFITSTSIGFGDFAPEVSKQYISTHAYILVGLTIMSLWLSCAGGYFFMLVRCGLKHTPSLSKPGSSSDLATDSATTGDSDRRGEPNRLGVSSGIAQISHIIAQVVQSSLVQSWTALVLSLVVAALVLTELENGLAKESAREWWVDYNTIVADFNAQELNDIAEESMNGTATVAAKSGLSADIDKALALLDSMGTCSAPPDDDQAVDFSFRASMLYAFYIVTTIGYGDANVQSTWGKRFVVIYACIGMWLYGWAADAMTTLIENAIASMGRRVLRCYSVCKGRLQKHKHHEDEDEIKGSPSDNSEAGGDDDKWLMFVLTVGAGVVFILIAGRMLYVIEGGSFYAGDPGGQTWSYFDSIWFVVVTSTSIGFGDMVSSMPAYML
jgi:hypothetical protein